jgi:predicted nucleic acid-binding Zn ribbon protein
MAELRKCATCGSSISEGAARCPKCGATPVSDKSTRIRGWVLLVIGIFLTVTMGVVAWQSAPTMLRPGELIDNSRFTGSVQLSRLALALFGAVIAFGLMAGAQGVYQIKTGRQHKWLLRGLMVVLTLILALGYAVMNTR